jgi:vacuolar-type H+-ATPase subunit H
MRVSVPDMIRQAERTLGERDRIIAQANEEASRIIGIARKQATDMVESHELSLSAQRRADEIIVEAERESATMRAEADGYALKALQDLAQQLERIHREVENGISALAAAKSARTK